MGPEETPEKSGDSHRSPNKPARPKSFWPSLVRYLPLLLIVGFLRSMWNWLAAESAHRCAWVRDVLLAFHRRSRVGNSGSLAARDRRIHWWCFGQCDSWRRLFHIGPLDHSDRWLNEVACSRSPASSLPSPTWEEWLSVFEPRQRLLQKSRNLISGRAACLVANRPRLLSPGVCRPRGPFSHYCQY